MNGLDERFTKHEGRPLRYLTGGTGPALLLCHGFIGSAENFADWFDVLLTRRTIIAPDLPGFGRSAPLAGGHTAPALARAALAAASDVGTDSFDVAGLCLGTPVALAVQRARPQATQRLILHTPLVAPSLIRRRFHLQVGFMLAPVIYPGIVWLGHNRMASDIYKRFMVEGKDVDPVAAKANFDNQLLANPRAAREWLHDVLHRDDLAQVRGSGHSNSHPRRRARPHRQRAAPRSGGDRRPRDVVRCDPPGGPRLESRAVSAPARIDRGVSRRPADPFVERSLDRRCIAACPATDQAKVAAASCTVTLCTCPAGSSQRTAT